MRIDDTNKHEVMQLLKEGKTLYVKSYAGNIAEVWKIALFGEFVIYDDQQGFKCECDVSACLKYNFWDQILCDENGKGVSLGYYEQEVISAKGTPHKHYDMIVKWACEPGKYKVQWKDYCGSWVDVSAPGWHEGDEYRFKPGA